MKSCWIVLMTFAGFAVLPGGAGCAATSPGGQPAEVEAGLLPESLTKKSAELDVPQPQWKGQADRERFKKAHSLVGQKKFEEALELLKLNIEETPNAGDIDYSYGWACVCLAELERFDEALEYYGIIRRSFYGWRREGAGGANRSWDDCLERVRNVVAGSEHLDKARVLERMLELDKQALENYLGDTEELIRRISRGDQWALLKLGTSDERDYRETMIKLIELGRLRLAGQE